MILEAYLTPVLCAWLSLEDFVKLDSASSKEMHETILAFMRTNSFREMRDYEIRNIVSFYWCQNVMGRLQWVQRRNVHVPNMELLITDTSLLLNEICRDEEGDFSFISKVTYSAYHLPDSVAFGAAFVKLKPDELDMRNCVRYSSVRQFLVDDLSELLAVLASVCSHCPMRVISLKDIDLWEHLQVSHVTSLGLILTHCKDKMECLSLPACIEVPPDLLEKASQCPNLKSLFPGSALSRHVLPDFYLTLCTKMPKLEELCFNSDHHDIEDKRFLAVVNSLPFSLKFIDLNNQPYLSLLSLTAAYKCLPNVCFLKMTDICFEGNIDLSTKNYHYKLTSSYKITSQDVTEGRLLDFLQTIPPLNELAINTYAISHAIELGAQLRRVDCSRIATLSVGHLSLEEVSHLLPALDNVTLVELKGIDDDYPREDAFAFLHALCQHCNEIKKLALAHASYLNDKQIELICNNLPNLVVMHFRGDYPYLTKNVLLSMARTDRVWQYFYWPNVTDPDTNAYQIKAKDLQEAIEQHGLKIKVLAFEKDFSNYVIGDKDGENLIESKALSNLDRYLV